MKKLYVQCPKCGFSHGVSLSLFSGTLGKMTSEKKARAARLNGKKGGAPKRNSPPIPKDFGGF